MITPWQQNFVDLESVYKAFTHAGYLLIPQIFIFNSKINIDQHGPRHRFHCLLPCLQQTALKRGDLIYFPNGPSRMTFREIDFGDMYFVASATYWGSMGAERWAVTSYLFRFDQRAIRRFGTKNHDVLTASRNFMGSQLGHGRGGSDFSG